jgi:hypothetical protein
MPSVEERVEIVIARREHGTEVAVIEHALADRPGDCVYY